MSEIIGLRGYVQYESHIAVTISVRIIQRYIGLVEATHKISENTYQNRVKLNNKYPSNRDWALLGLIQRSRVQFPEQEYGPNSCYMVAHQVMVFVALGQMGLNNIAS